MANSPLKIYKYLCEYRFKPESLLYYELNNKIGDYLFKDYKHWQTDGKKILLSDFSDRSVLAIEHNRICLEMDIPGGIDIHQKKFEGAWNKYKSEVKVETFFRLGFRLNGLIPVDFDFSELADLTYSKLLCTKPELTNIVGTDLQDYMYNVITKHEGFTVHLICGPVKKKEISNWYSPARLLLSSGEEPLEVEYPDVALWIDCDCYVQQPNDEETQNFYRKAFRTTNDIAIKLNQYLFAES